MESVFMITLVAAAVITDYLYFKIPNAVILWGMTTMIFYNLCFRTQNNSCSQVVGGILLLFLVLFPLYVIKAMGAGDVKLLCVICGFAGFPYTCKILFVALLVGGLIGGIKIIIELVEKHERSHNVHRIHFSYAILLASFLVRAVY